GRVATLLDAESLSLAVFGCRRPARRSYSRQTPHSPASLPQGPLGGARNPCTMKVARSQPLTIPLERARGSARGRERPTQRNHEHGKDFACRGHRSGPALAEALSAGTGGAARLVQGEQRL